MGKAARTGNYLCKEYPKPKEIATKQGFKRMQYIMASYQDMLKLFVNCIVQLFLKVYYRRQDIVL
jgi:hypothetical protein